MGYAKNPRRIYGKVEIIYCDEELSRDVVVTESSNSEISHPREVYHLPSEPTVKACTMDGNSTMDGTYQMMNRDGVVGWWSGQCSNASGVFVNKPWIELIFTNRPIIYWRIIGDTKLNQYPVDFTIEYKRNGVVVRTETITGNTECNRQLAPRIDDITGIRMTITKWSAPNGVAKILRFFERVSEVYEGDALQSFDVGEELSNQDGNYNLNSDTMSVVIYNEDRKFDKGYLRTLLLLDRKVNPFIGVENDKGEVDYISLGMFYSDEWNIDQDSQWVKCSATDRLMRLQEKVYIGFPLMDNVSLYDIAEDILQKSGLTAVEYKISEKLKDMVVATAFLPKTKVWDALQEIANAGLCNIFVDRDNKIIIETEEDKDKKSQVKIVPGNTFSWVSNITLTEFANSISVDYCEVNITDDMIDVAETELTLDAGQRLSITIDFTSDVAYPIIESSNLSVRIENFESGVNSATCTLINSTAIPQTTTILIQGNAIEIVDRTITAQDEESILNYGVVEFSHPTSELVQSQEQAEYIASVLIKKMHAGEGVITTMWRGNPELGLGERYDATDRFGDDVELVCEYNKFSYDGGLKQETRGRKKIRR